MLLWIGLLLSALCAGASYYLAYQGFSLQQDSCWFFLAGGFFLTMIAIGLVHRLWSTRHQQTARPVVFVNHIALILIIAITVIGILTTIVLTRFRGTG